MRLQQKIQSADTSARLTQSPITLSLTTVNKLSNYLSPWPGYFPVIVFGNVANNRSGLTEEALKQLAGAGVNVIAPKVSWTANTFRSDCGADS